LALASAGVSAGFVLGVPLATALGNAVGWRGAFAALAALMALALVLILVKLPAVEALTADTAAIPSGLSDSNPAGSPCSPAAASKTAFTSAAVNTRRALLATHSREWSSMMFRISTSVWSASR
jgi:predicted MFS family arabinose efflux permease